jgi:predicted phosphodiesterase
MVCDVKLNPAIDYILADDLLNELSNFDVIITGHNHKHFIVQQGNRILINPGSLSR